MSNADAFVRAFDESGDYAQHQIEAAKQLALEEIDDLLRSSENRDRQLWGELDVDMGATLGDYEEEDDRDLDWMLGFAAMGAAASTQFAMDNADELILFPIAYRHQLLIGYDMSTGDLMAAGRRGGVGLQVESVTEFRKLEAQYLNDLATLRSMDPVELYRQLREYNAIPPIEKATAKALGFVERMSGFAARTPQFLEAASGLVDHLAGRGLMAQTRRAIERIDTQIQSLGDLSKLFVWMCEGGRRTCGYCLSRAGEVKTLRQWTDEGMPGADVCIAGDLCKCGLWAV